MNGEFLYEAITLIDDDLIDAAATYTPKAKKVIHWKRWAALAACLVLVVGAGSLGLFGGRMGGGSKSDAPATPGSDPGNTGSAFMSYAGPVFPLTVLESSDGITAQRDLTLDFAPWVPIWVSNTEEAASRSGLTAEEQQEVLELYNKWYPEGGRNTTSTDVLVTDTYSLYNSTAEDKTLTVLYPFVSSLLDYTEDRPTLTLGGIVQETEAVFGLYPGGFQGSLGSDDPKGSVNLDQPTSWTDYQFLLSDGSYLEQSLGEYPDFSDLNVIVYEFTNPRGDAESKEKPNPSIRVTFDMDYDKTTVLSYGFHSGSFAREAGKMGQGFSIPQPFEPRYGQSFYLIILGDDVANMEISGYVTGGWTTKEKLDECSVDVNRYETDLDSVLRTITADIYTDYDFQYGSDVAVDFETYYGLYCDHLASYGVLAEDGGAERYDHGWLAELSEVAAVDRVCYLKTQITVPAQSSVEVTASMAKSASFDYYGSSSKSPNVKGYDVVTQLGSTLTFTEQTAALLDRGQIEITRQNFGFDPAQGITTVVMDPAMEHYYLEVQRKPQTDKN